MFYKASGAMPISMSLEAHSDQTGTVEPRLNGANVSLSSRCMLQRPCYFTVRLLLCPCYFRGAFVWGPEKNINIFSRLK